MASNFSANQFEKEFKARSLCNWEVPHWYPKHPRRRTTTTNFIANERGHLLPNVQRPKSSPWGRFQNTWQMPAIITRETANEINGPQIGYSRWALPDPSRKVSQAIQVQIKKEEKEDKPLKAAAKFVELEQVDQEVEQPKKIFNEKEKLNNPIAIAQQGKRAIRHETLERDNDEH